MSGVTAHIGGLASFIQPEYRIPVLVEVKNSASLMAPSKFAIASQLIGQLLDVIDGPPQKFAVRIAILEEIRDAWAADQEVLVTTLSARYYTSQKEDELTALELDPSNENPAVIGSDCPQDSEKEPCASQDLEDSTDGRDQVKLTDLKTEDEGSVTSLDLQNLLREGEVCGDYGFRDSDTGGKLSDDTTYDETNDLVIGLFENATDHLMREPSGDQDVGSDGKAVSPQTASKAVPVDTTNEHLSLVCKRCSQSFRVGESSLDRPFACPHCQQNSGRQGPSLKDAAGITSIQSKAASAVGTAAGASRKSTRPFQCNVCKKKFKREGHLEDHFRIHTNEKPFSCGICEKMFRTTSNCREHEKTHQNRRGIPQSSEARRLRKSDNSLADTELSLKLPAAKRQQSRQQSTAVKPKTKGNTSVAGPVSDEDSYPTPADGPILRQKTSNAKKAYSCNVCDVACASKADLTVHMNSHQNQCKNCGTLFPTRVEFEHHKKTCGSVRSSSKAQVGKARCTSVSIRKKYEQIRKTKKTHMCTSCKKVFPTVRDLRRHKQIHLNLKPHVCDTCNKSFNSASHLKVHKRVHTGEKPFRCSICKWKFSQNTHLKMHWKRIHKLEILRCKYCRRTFCDPDKLRHHEQNHHRVMKGHPAQGDLSLSGGDRAANGSPKNVSASDRTKNHTAALPTMSQYACDVCEESFQNLKGLQTHYKIHTSKSLFRCEHCRECFSTKSSLSEHEASVHAKMLIKCKVCSKGFLSDRDLRAHKKIHQRELQIEPDISEVASAQCQLMPGRAQEDQTERTYQRHQCEKTFTRKDSLVRHIKTHTRKRRHVCYKCGKTFASNYNLTRHRKLQHRPSRCVNRQKFFPSKVALQKHATVRHNSKRHPGDVNVPVTCGLGGLKESVCSDFDSNVASAAPPEKSDPMTLRNVKQVKHQCRFCPRVLSSRYRVKCHEKLHSHRELFPCHVCQKRFSTKGYLVMHMRTHTTKALSSPGNQSSATKIGMTTKNVNLVKSKNEYKCRYCGKILNNNSHLTDHERIHTGEKPFSCDVCKTSFTAKRSLSSHLASSQHALNCSGHKMAHSAGYFTDHLAHVELSRTSHQLVHTNYSSTFQHANTSKSHNDKLAKANGQHGPSHKLSHENPNQRKFVQEKSPTVQLHRAEKSTTRRQAHASRISAPKRTSPARSQGPTITRSKTPNQSNRSPKTVSQNQSKTFSCRVCHKVFLSQELLKRHKKVHTDNNRQSLVSTPATSKKVSKKIAYSSRFICKCKYCGKTFNHRGHWRDHLRVHTGEKPFRCNICGQAFSTRSNIRRHNLIHMKHKPATTKKVSKKSASSGRFIAKCKYCGKTFNNSGHWRDHLRVHTGEKPFRCSICGQAYSTKSYVTKHKLIHMKHKPATTKKVSKKSASSGRFICKCKYCGKTFNNRGHWREHLRVHTGEKPFACKTCGRAFSTKSYAKKHELIHIK